MLTTSLVADAAVELPSPAAPAVASSATSSGSENQSVAEDVRTTLDATVASSQCSTRKMTESGEESTDGELPMRFCRFPY